MSLISSIVAASGLSLRAVHEALPGGVNLPRQLATPSSASFVRRGLNGVAVLGTYAYIDGGEVAQLINGSSTTSPSYSVNETLSISLSAPWTNRSAQVTPLQKPAPDMDSQTLWVSPSSDSFYIWGGQTPYAAQPGADLLWKFSADGKGGGTWNSEVPSDTSLVRLVHGSATQSHDTGFVLGGRSNPWTDPSISLPSGSDQPVPGLVSFNMTTKAWRNDSAAAFAPPSGTYVDGTLAFVPTFGAQGILVPLGGFNPGLLPTSDVFGFLDFSNISVYDIASRQWYWQAASGSMPTPRRALCSVSVQASGAGTSEIFIFGGFNDLYDITYDEVYVLSLPGFVWSQAQYIPRAPRGGHACAVAGNRQMLVAGGVRLELGFPWNWGDADPWPQGLGVFDLTAMGWSSSYDPNAAPYSQPEVVSNWYKNGNAVVWSSDGVKNFFSGSNSSNPTPPPPPAPAASQTRLNIGAIVGGAIGATVLLVVIGLVIYIAMRRKRTSTEKVQAITQWQQKNHELAAGQYFSELHGTPAPAELPSSPH